MCVDRYQGMRENDYVSMLGDGYWWADVRTGYVVVSVNICGMI